jgi:hypothetical protein
MTTLDISDSIKAFREEHAAKVIQQFYKSYIKTDRDPKSGLPMDPITGDPIEKKNIIRIIYETYNNGSKLIIKRLQCYDITTLWESFKYSKNNIALNPLVNTRFLRSQFKQILRKAIEVDIIKADEMKKYLSKYGYEAAGIGAGGNSGLIDSHSSSIYEMNQNDNKKKFKEIYYSRLCTLICYYALKNDYNMLEILVFLSLEYDKDIDNDKMQIINYVKKVGAPLQKFPPNTSLIMKKHIKKFGANPIYDNIELDPAVENRLTEYGIKHYSVLNACAFNQNAAAMLFVMQFTPYLFHPYMSDTGISPLHMVLVNDIVDVDVIDVLRSYYSDADLDKASSIGSIMDLALTKIEIQPEIMTKLFG